MKTEIHIYLGITPPVYIKFNVIPAVGPALTAPAYFNTANDTLFGEEPWGDFLYLADGEMESQPLGPASVTSTGTANVVDFPTPGKTNIVSFPKK